MTKKLDTTRSGTWHQVCIRLARNHLIISFFISEFGSDPIIRRARSKVKPRCKFFFPLFFSSFSSGNYDTTFYFHSGVNTEAVILSSVQKHIHTIIFTYWLTYIPTRAFICVYKDRKPRTLSHHHPSLVSSPMPTPNWN